MAREGDYEFTFLTEELLIIDGFWGKESQFSLSLCVALGRLTMLKWMVSYLEVYAPHKLDSIGY